MAIYNTPQYSSPLNRFMQPPQSTNTNPLVQQYLQNYQQNNAAFVSPLARMQYGNQVPRQAAPTAAPQQVTNINPARRIYPENHQSEGGPNNNGPTTTPGPGPSFDMTDVFGPDIADAIDGIDMTDVTDFDVSTDVPSSLTNFGITAMTGNPALGAIAGGIHGYNNDMNTAAKNNQQRDMLGMPADPYSRTKAVMNNLPVIGWFVKDPVAMSKKDVDKAFFDMITKAIDDTRGKGTDIGQPTDLTPANPTMGPHNTDNSGGGGESGPGNDTGVGGGSAGGKGGGEGSDGLGGLW